MAPKLVTYNNSKPYSGPLLQPLADIVLHGPATNFSIANVLVDTGADFLMVSASSAATAGLLPGMGTPIYIRTAGGTVTMTKHTGVFVEIEGIRVITDLLCHPSPTSRPLLGRQALSALKDVGFDTTSWLWP
jgi:predicted aspartyl protease